MAVPAAGTFTASQILRIQTIADDLWADNRTRIDYIAECDVVKAIQAEQTAQLDALTDPNRTNTVRLIWPLACEVTDTAVTDDCSFTGTEASSTYQDYALDITREAKFAVKEIEGRTDQITMAQKIAVLSMQADKQLSEYVAEQVVAKIEAERGINTYVPTLENWALSGDSLDTEIPATQWDSTIMPRLRMAARKNKFLNPYLLSGEALWYVNEEAMNNSGNDDGSGDDVRMKRYFRAKYFDPIKIDEVNGSDLKAYMIDRGALAFVSKSHYPGAPTVYQNPWQTRYTVQSRNIPGLEFEVVYTMACSSGEITHTWKYKINCGIFRNPLGCTETNTGILSFLKLPAA